MAEIKGYLLTKEEENACVDLIKKLRERKVFAVDFSGYVFIRAKTSDEAQELFWEWIGDLQDKSLDDWSGVVTQPPYFEYDGAEEN